MANPHGNSNSDSFFFFAIVYEIRFQVTEKTNELKNKGELKNDLSEFFLIKGKLKLDFHILNFEQQCHRVNQILNKCNFFSESLRIKREISIAF